MTLRAIFAANMRRLRRERGLSQETLAHTAGVERSYIGKLENEAYSVSLDTMERIAVALQVDAAHLLEPAPEPPKRRRKTKPPA